jgi:hypothetical protein
MKTRTPGRSCGPSVRYSAWSAWTTRRRPVHQVVRPAPSFWSSSSVYNGHGPAAAPRCRARRSNTPENAVSLTPPRRQRWHHHAGAAMSPGPSSPMV